MNCAFRSKHTRKHMNDDTMNDSVSEGVVLGYSEERIN